MGVNKDKQPAAEESTDIDAMCGQAAWMLAQVLALRLVKNEMVSKELMKSDLVEAITHCRHDQGVNAAQRGAGHLLAQFHTLVDSIRGDELN